MVAFQKFNEINKLENIHEKHRTWLKDYEGKTYSIAVDGKHQIKWATEKKEYHDTEWNPSINMIKELPNRLRIEFDDKDENKAKENLELAYKKLKENNIGFIRSTHKGKTDYLWVEFNEDVKKKQKQGFLIWVSPEGSIVDLNFTSDRKVFPILYAVHWKHSFERELPIEYFEGEQIDLSKLNIKTDKIVSKFSYSVGEVFTRKGQAKTFIESQPIFYDKGGLFWLWNNTEKKWEITDEVELLNYIEQSTGQDVINSKNRVEIINSLKQSGRKNIPLPIKKTWIQFQDKIYDVETGENFEATSKYFVTNPIPYKISGDPRTPVMDRIFKEWVGENYVETLKEIIAYSILPDYPIHRLFCLIGSGLNGKSCFLRLLTKFIGEENKTSTELDTLLTSRFEVTRLHKKLVCIMGETNFSEISKTSIIKKLTGQDTIGFEYKNKNPFDDYNYAKIFIATNNLPTTTDKTLGFYRRWLIIDFPNQFNEKKDILDEIPSLELDNLATNSIILLQELLKKREFHNEGSVEDRAKKYEDKSNFFDKFWAENIEESFDSYISVSSFEQKLNNFCKNNRQRMISSKDINERMKEKGIEQDRPYMEWYENDKTIKKQVRSWMGIKWK